MFFKTIQKLLNPKFAIPILFVSYVLVLTSFTIRRGFVDKCDGYNYLASGYSLIENHREFTFININSYSDFQKSPSNYEPKQRPYPNKLYSILSYFFAKDEGHLVPSKAAWYSIAISSIGFIFFYLICHSLASPLVAFVSCILLLYNPTLISYLGRPLTDPSAWSMAMGSFYFLIRKNPRSLIFSGLFAGLATCFRLQSIFLIPVILIETFFRRNSLTKQQKVIFATSAMLAFLVVYFVIVTVIESAFLKAPTTSNSNSQFYLSWYVEVFSKFSFLAYFNTFLQIMSQVLTSPPIGLFLILSFLKGTTFRTSKSIQTIHAAALFAFFLPVLIYSSSQGFETRYLIYSIPIFIFCSVINLRDLIVLKFSRKWDVPLIDRQSLAIFSVGLAFLILTCVFTFSPVRFNKFVGIQIPIESLKPSESSSLFIMSNKSIATVNTGRYNLVKLPKFLEFTEGDNSLVSSILIYNDNNCAWENSADSLDWQNKAELTDRMGNKFRLNTDKSFFETLVYEKIQ